MPYKTIAQLPPMVKNALPAEAQRTFMAAYNAAFAKNGGDEMKCAAVAWGAVKKAFKKDEKGAWVPVETNADASMGHIDLYLSDVTSSVHIVTGANGNLVAKGLPVLKVGTWNGKSYTADDLKVLASNFAEIQASDSWEPPLRPYHAYDREGKPIVHSAAETLGWHKAMYYDEPSELLLADVELVKRETAAAMLSNQLRYVSSEVGRDHYKSPVTDKAYALAYMGGAFVDNPAVKGMPWSIVLNAADYTDWSQPYEEPLTAEPVAVAVVDELAEDTAGSPGTPAGHPGTEGVRSMSLIETLKAKFKVHGVPDVDLVELDRLSEAPAEPATPTPPVTAAPPADDGLRRQVELHAQTIQTLQATIDQQGADARHAQAQAQVKEWVIGGVLPPAKSVACYALLDALMAAPGGEVDVLSADGKETRKVTPLDLLGEIVTGSAPIHVGNPRGAVLTLETDNPAGRRLMTEDELKKAVGK